MKVVQEVGPGGLRVDSVVLVDQTRALGPSWVVKYLCQLTPREDAPIHAGAARLRW